MLILILILSIATQLGAVLYNCYTGQPATEKEVRVFEERNNTQYCLIDIKPCDPEEWSRVDGSCNNLKYPSRGMTRTPLIKYLDSEFSPNYEPRNSKDGEPLPLPRYLRTQLLNEGKVVDLRLTLLVMYYYLFIITDVNFFHDLINYTQNTTNCCEPEGKLNYMCTPTKIPVDDPVHRYSGVSCMNLTRPQSFQSFGCVDFGTPFARINFVTSVFDLSIIYGSENVVINDLRTFQNGLLKIEKDNGLWFPPRNPSSDNKVNGCVLNEPPRETRCNKHQPNGSPGSVILIILFYRQHNYIARQLANMNPCWDDERLFYTARDINIAIAMQIYLYELLPVLFGKQNMINDGILSPSRGFRDEYKGEIPVMADEFPYIHRWYHTVQETTLKLYDREGYFLKAIPLLNVTVRTGFFALDNNLEQVFQGSFRQYNPAFDHVIDPDVAERILGGEHFASDVTANDLAKGRYGGFAPYVKYREFCANKPYKTFQSLNDVMSKERIYHMTELYKNVEDIDLIAGVWAENRMHGGLVPPTVYCLTVEHLKRIFASDRHWYERRYRPHAFTYDQLQAIRDVKIAGVMCLNGDGVTKIQPNAFYSICPKNPLTDCRSSKVGKINLSPWKYPNCKQHQ